MKYLKIATFTFLLAIFFGHLIYRVSIYSKEYATRFDPDYWKKRYLESQWVVPDSKNSIGDDGLYSYVSWELIHGADPTTVANAEVPPLGKYIIGVGEIIFQNQNVLSLIIGILCLAVFYILNLQIFKNRLISFIPVFLFSLDQIFYSQLRAPYLDSIYLLFLLLTLLFTLRRNYFVASFFLGCFASTKYPLGSVFLLVPISLWVFIFHKKEIKRFFISLAIYPIVFLLSYIRFFLLGNNLSQLLGVQKWIVQFYLTGAKATVGIVFPMVLFGKWYTWFGGVQKVTEWTFIWPVSLIGSAFSTIPLVPFMKLHKEQNISLIFLWVVSYIIFLTFTPVFPRYLLLLLPFMYNLTVWFSVKFVIPRF